jgi:hypothetical protein
MNKLIEAKRFAIDYELTQTQLKRLIDLVDGQTGTIICRNQSCIWNKWQDTRNVCMAPSSITIDNNLRCLSSIVYSHIEIDI